MEFISVLNIQSVHIPFVSQLHHTEEQIVPLPDADSARPTGVCLLIGQRTLGTSFQTWKHAWLRRCEDELKTPASLVLSSSTRASNK
jgi:hypothetical protein